MQCLTDFVDAQLNYFNACSKTLQDLSRQIGGMGIVNNSSGTATGRSLPSFTTSKLVNNSTEIIPTTTTTTTQMPNGGSNLPSSLTNKKTAKVLFDYEATDPSEISVSANQVNNKK